MGEIADDLIEQGFMDMYENEDYDCDNYYWNRGRSVPRRWDPKRVFSEFKDESVPPGDVPLKHYILRKNK